ncbi:MAG: hypothetical protein KQI35_16980 [Bacteroidetes bacterium]|nr:hypothetical protein [Bacteroidota bacterium]
MIFGKFIIYQNDTTTNPDYLFPELWLFLWPDIEVYFNTLFMISNWLRRIPFRGELSIGILVIVLSSCTSKPSSDHLDEKLSFSCTDTTLTQSFEWAQSKALSFAHEGDPVGKWYEAALPNREAFCMRDVAHQTTGAAILGLREHNLNMLKKFAANITESKDYCSYWEINRYDQPAPVDYKNDDDFWYNLPANFDIMQACYQQYLWTGDSTYIDDRDLQNFYQLSVGNYVSRWQLGVDDVLSRNRLINIKHPENPDSSFFYDKRGIPTYNEGGRARTQLGIDMTASLYAGYNSYANMLKMKGDDTLSAAYDLKAKGVKSFLDSYWWDANNQSYRSVAYDDGSFDYFKVGDNQAFLLYLLHFGILDDHDRITMILNRYDAFKDSLIVELASYLPKYFYRCGYSEAAGELIKKLCDTSNLRRDYPENSFSVVDAIATGLMGVEPDASKNMITTISNLPESMEWANMDHVKVFSGSISVSHEKRKRSTLTNNINGNIIWKACFYGDFQHLIVDDIDQPAKHVTDIMGRRISYVLYEIEPQETITINIP